MKLTKLDHSGFYLENNGRGLLFDPVEYGNSIPDFNNIDVVVITHKHGDHFQPKILEKILQKNPNAKVFTTNDTVGAIPNAIVVKPGEKATIGGFDLEFFGSGNHAAIYNNEIPCENLGVVVNDKIVNPGDSFDVPNLKSIEVLFVPISAPWLKTEESIKYIEALRPKIAINTHDGLLSEMGLNITNNWLSQKAAAVGTEYKFLRFGEEMATEFEELANGTFGVQ